MTAWQGGPLQRRLGLRYPIVQGPFGGGLSSARLVATVAEAGGLGSFGVHHLDGDGIARVVADIRALTARPFALNLWLPFEDSEAIAADTSRHAAYAAALAPYFAELGVALPAAPSRYAPAFDEQLEAVLAARPAVLSLVFGVPSPGLLARCRALGIVTIAAATTVAEAQALDAAGVDMIVASGSEAGGHRVSFLAPPEQVLTGTLALVPQVVDAVRVPVIAAGGMADGRGVAAALMLGAAGAQLGTAFLACEESAAAPLHRQALFSPAAADTALTRTFSGRLARGIRNRLLREGAVLTPAPYPVQNWLMGELKRAAFAAGRSDLGSLWCGQAAPLLQHRHAAALMAALVAQAEQLLGASCPPL